MIIKTDSRKIKKGDVFVALKGNNYDGHDFICDAIKRGAGLIVCECGNYDVQTLIVPDTRSYLCEYLREIYHYIFSKIKIIGVTGTNGKTTTAFLIHKSLNKLGIKCAYIGTIGFYINKKIKNLKNTTPDILEIYELLLKCYQNDCLYVTMEVSSQALSMHRVDGILFDYAIFTNLTQDHLDYHKTMENYCLAKMELFKKLKKDGIAIVNYDDKYKNYFLFENNKNITYGFNKSDYQITNYKLKNYKQEFLLNNEKYVVNLLGKYNVYNIVNVIIILKQLGFEYKNIKKIISNIKAPIGRMEVIKNKTNLYIVDYAHTPDAVEQVIKTINEIKKNRVVTIIGCGGNRDKDKRHIIGEVATRYSDYVIFTSDNPRFENPNSIIEDIIYNLNCKNYEVIVNRKEAIKKGIQILEINDILLVLGKGHENYQIVGNKVIYFSDKKTIQDLIRR